MYLPNALRKGVFDFLPHPPLFNWFFFGKKFFDSELDTFVLQIDKFCQLYCSESGTSYGVLEPSTFLIVREEDSPAMVREVCKREKLAGYVYRVRDVSAPMAPPVPCDVVFWVFPEVVAPIDRWTECRVLRYAARDPGNSWKGVRDLVGQLGIEGASRLLMREK